MRAAQARKRRVKSHIADLETGEVAKIEREVTIDPQEGEVQGMVARAAREFDYAAEFYLKRPMTPDEARERARTLHDENRAEYAESLPVDKLDWGHMAALAGVSMQKAIETWEAIKQKAREDIASGVYISETITPDASPIERARLFAIREELQDGWKPTNGIEHTLIDMMGLSFYLYLHWTAILYMRTTNESNEREQMQRQSPYSHERKWKVPRFDEGMAVDQATRLADGYNRQFLRTLRTLRDLRRYAQPTPPVIVNQQGGQVNVANQQLNVAQTI
jgi:hypothetical protein